MTKSPRAKVQATELQSLEEVFHSDIPGAFFVAPEKGSIYYICPCGCGEFNSLPVKLGEKEQYKWQWNGKIQGVSLHPSIKRMDGCKYHGYLTDGEWSFAGDSGK